jgi:2-methylcitrate dehydratase PrpD
MIVDRGASFASVNDVSRMKDPNILAVRKLVELVPSQELQEAKPPRQAIIHIDTIHGHAFTNHTTLVRGTPGNPMNAKEVEAKAKDLIGPVLGATRTDELVATIFNLEKLGPLSGLRPLLRA